MQRQPSRPARLDEAAARFARFADRHRAPFAVALGVLAVVAVLPSAVWKPLWYDELFTFHVSRLTSIGAIRDALASGLDQQPLPYFALHHSVFRMFGEGPLATRLPELAGFALMTGGVFAFVSHRAGAVCGALAAVACWSTEARQYATEARPYALLAGFSAVSIACWQRSTDGGRRGAWLAGLAVSLFGVVSSHWYGVLVVVPLAIGEGLRSLRRKKIDVAVWVAFGAAVLPIVFFLLPILASLTGLRASFWSRPTPAFAVEFYGWLLAPAAIPLAATLAGFGVWLAAGSPGRRTPQDGEAQIPVHEVGAALALALLPCFGLALAVVFTNALNERYVIPAVVGLAALFGFAARTATTRPLVLVSWLVLVLGSFLARQVLVARWVYQDRDRVSAVHIDAARAEPALPIVVQDPLVFLEYAKHAPAPIVARLRYLADPAAQQAFTGFANVDPGLLVVRAHTDLPIEPAGDFLASHERFYLLWTPGRFGWLLQKLSRDGVGLEVIEAGTDRVVVLVDRSQQPRESGGGRTPPDRPEAR